jgi:hypothetical protein
VPRLLEAHELTAVTGAVERALTLRVVDAEAGRLLLEQARQPVVGGCDLAGRPRLSAVRLPPPDLSAYAHLSSGKGGKS